MVCKPIEIYIYARKKHPFVIPQQSTQNTTNLRLQTYKKNQWTFFNYPERATTLAPAIILLKVSAPVGSIIPCWTFN